MVRANAPCRFRFWEFPRNLPKKRDRRYVAPASRRRFSWENKRCKKAGPSCVRASEKPALRKTVLEFLFVFRRFLSRDLHGHADASRSQIFQDGLSIFQRDRSRWKNARRFTRKIFDEQRGHVRRGIRDGRKRQSALPNLVERRKYGVAPDFDWMILLHAARHDGCREPRILQNTFADQSRDLSRRRRFWVARAATAARTRKFPLPVPAPQSVDFVPADFYIHFPQRKKIRNRADLILRRQHNSCFADRRWKSEFFSFAEAFAVA